MTTDDTLTLAEVADRLGVHYMTVYRYVRLGVLPAVQQDRQWVVRGTDLDVFTASGGRAPRGKAAWDRRFLNRLLAVDEAGSWGVIEAAAASGMDLVDAYRMLIVPALTEIGTMWETGRIDVATEHGASQVATRIVARLGARVRPRGVRRGTVVIGSTASELHALPLAIAADVLRFARFDVIDLGPNLPAVSFAGSVAAAGDLVAVCIGVTTSGQVEQVAETLHAIRAVSTAPIIVGGGGISEEQATELGADAWARTADDAVAALESLLAA